MPEPLRLAAANGQPVRDASVPAQLDPVSTFRPWETPEKLQARRRLHNAAILSAARAVGARADSARDVFWMINTRANRWMLEHASTDDLMAIGDALARLLTAADTFERLEGSAS